MIRFAAAETLFSERTRAYRVGFDEGVVSGVTRSALMQPWDFAHVHSDISRGILFMRKADIDSMHGFIRRCGIR